MKKLTVLSINSLPVGEFPDPYCPGLIIRIGKNRSTWEFRYRQGGKRHRDRLGYYPMMGLAEAREAAGSLGKRIDAGLRAAPETVVHPRSPEALTLGKLIDKYEALRRKEGSRIKRLDEALRTVRRGLKDYLDLPAREFSKNDLRAARDAINEGKSHMGNRLLGYTSPILKWAASEDIIDFNFAGTIRRAAENRRERVLSRKELKAIWHATFELGDSAPVLNFGRMVRFLACTAQRIGEAAALRHGDILDGVWKQRDNKASRPTKLKLPPLALQQVGSGEAKGLAFAGEAGTKIGAVSKLKARLDAASGVTAWRLHDLRRTCATGMQELGISNDVVQGVLNHSIAGVGGVYLRSQMEAAKAEALARWADELGGIVDRERVA